MIEHVAARMDAIGAAYDDADAPVVSLRDQTKTLLRDSLLLTRVKLPSKYMGTHPDNRFGDMVVPQDVPALISRAFRASLGPWPPITFPVDTVSC